MKYVRQCNVRGELRSDRAKRIVINTDKVFNLNLIILSQTGLRTYVNNLGESTRMASYKSS